MLHMVRLFLASLSLSFLVVSLASGPVMAAEKGRAMARKTSSTLWL